MTRGPRSFRWAVRIIPGRWRESVERDLLEEAARSGRRGLRLGTWLTIQTLGIGLALLSRSFREWWGTRPNWQSALEGIGLDVRLAWRRGASALVHRRHRVDGDTSTRRRCTATVPKPVEFPRSGVLCFVKSAAVLRFLVGGPDSWSVDHPSSGRTVTSSVQWPGEAEVRA